MLKNTGVTVIYSTDTVRTLETAKPLAHALQITVRKYAAKGADGGPDLRPLADRLKSEHARDVVFVVGHSDTVPALLKALGCSEEVQIAADRYDDLFVVVPTDHASPTLLRLKS